MKYCLAFVSALICFVNHSTHGVGSSLPGFNFQLLVNKTGQRVFVTPNRLLNKPAVLIDNDSNAGPGLRIPLQNIVPQAMWITQIQFCSDSACTHVLATLPIIISRDSKGYNLHATFHIGSRQIGEWRSTGCSAHDSYTIGIILEKDLVELEYDKRELSKTTMTIQPKKDR